MGKNYKSTCAPIVYDPRAHREFVTGFRARKVARRERAIAEAAKNEKAVRLEERKERRQILRESREQFLQAVQDDDSDDEQDGDVIERKEYDHANVDNDDVTTGKVTTIVAPLDLKSSNVPFNEIVAARKGKDEQEETDKNHPNENSDVKRKDNNLLNKVVSVIGKKRKSKGGGRRHVSYTHKHHQKKGNKYGNKKTTHSERRKRTPQ